MLNPKVVAKLLPLLSEALESEPKFISVTQIGFAGDDNPFDAADTVNFSPRPDADFPTESPAQEIIFPEPIDRMIELHSITSIAKTPRGTLIQMHIRRSPIIVMNSYASIAEAISQL